MIIWQQINDKTIYKIEWMPRIAQKQNKFISYLTNNMHTSLRCVLSVISITTNSCNSFHNSKMTTEHDWPKQHRWLFKECKKLIKINESVKIIRRYVVLYKISTKKKILQNEQFVETWFRQLNCVPSNKCIDNSKSGLQLVNVYYSDHILFANYMVGEVNELEAVFFF